MDGILGPFDLRRSFIEPGISIVGRRGRAAGEICGGPSRSGVFGADGGLPSWSLHGFDSVGETCMVDDETLRIGLGGIGGITSGDLEDGVTFEIDLCLPFDCNRGAVSPCPATEDDRRCPCEYISFTAPK
jgi:hypothetical protein